MKFDNTGSTPDAEEVAVAAEPQASAPAADDEPEAVVETAPPAAAAKAAQPAPETADAQPPAQVETHPPAFSDSAEGAVGAGHQAAAAATPATTAPVVQGRLGLAAEWRLGWRRTCHTMAQALGLRRLQDYIQASQLSACSLFGCSETHPLWHACSFSLCRTGVCHTAGGKM